MYIEYKEANIEFANRILNCREELADGEVEKWLEEEGNRRLLDELAHLKQALKVCDFNELRSRELVRLSKEVAGRRFRVRGWWMSAAAMVVLSVGLWLWKYEPAVQVAVNSGQELRIRPGSAQAELILPGGRTVVLKKENASIDDGIVSGIVNDSVDGLNYSRATVALADAGIQYNVLKVPAGGFYKLELPDGTKVWLNAASELRFPARFEGGKREVFLNGEGYFQVTRDTVRQFVVHLKNSQVAVLGTVFNINAYEDEESVRTTLAEGAVCFYSEQSKQRLTLKPGMQSVMNVETGRTELAQVDPSVYTSWVDGRFVFHSLKLEDIMRQLQRWYDFETFYQNSEVRDYTFRGVVNRDMDLDRVLKMIERTTDVHFGVKNRTVVVGK